MGFLSVLSFAHQLASQRVQPGETVVDATVGNGVDTLFLAKLTGEKGRVYGFDIQQQALELAQTRLKKEFGGTPSSVCLCLSSHDKLETVLPAEQHGRVAAVMFNLGYLPGADHAVITTAESTLPALDASLRVLRPGGVLTVVLYTGHEGGPEEAAAVEAWAEALPLAKYQVLRYGFVNQHNRPPYLLAVEKR